MREILVVFASLTSANRVKAYLYKNYSLNAYVMQTPKKLEISGCSYCIKINENHLDYIINAVKQLSVSSKGVYRSDDYSKIK